MYVLISGGVVAKYPYSYAALLADNPGTSFPSEMPDAALATWGVFPVCPVERPAVDHTFNVSEAEPHLLAGDWLQCWIVTPASADEIARRLEARWGAIRGERNARLAACDWTQLSDAPVDAPTWAAYRQSLRDITKQADPFAVAWPPEPEIRS